MAPSTKTWRITLLYFLLVIVQSLAATKEEVDLSPNKLDPLKHREARSKVDLNARKEYYSKMLKESNGCPPPHPPPDPRPLPTVPDSFTTNIEITFQEYDQRATIYGQEMYDGVEQRGILKYQLAQLMFDSPDLLTETVHYNVKRNEALFVKENDGCHITGQEDCHSSIDCMAGTLDDLSKELERLFGVIAHPGHAGFIGASGILEFGPQFNYTQQMIETCHGLDCDVYQTCIEVPEENATLIYTYYWSTPDWFLGNNDQQVPIAVEIYGNKVDHTVTSVMRRYDYFDYKREVRPSKYELETPPDVYCYGRKSEFSPPKIAQTFFMHSEIIAGVDVPVKPGKNDTDYIRYRVIFPKTEYYDYSMRITRQDYVPFFASGNERRFENQTSLVHDFNQGLAYVIQPRQRLCKIQEIANITFGDVVVDEDGSVFMQSPWNYEDLDRDMQYNGRHWVRGLDAGVWLGIKKKDEGDDPETIAWYFASPQTHEISGLEGISDEEHANIELPTIDHVPIMMKKFLTSAPDLPPVTYNIYDFESEVPHVHMHDISLCYTLKDMMDLTFNLPADAINKTNHKIESLKYALVFALSDAGVVSPLRINKLEVRNVTGAVQVIFTLLEKPNTEGDIEMAGLENTLQQAYTQIKTKLDKSQLIVEVNVGKNPEKPDLVKLVGLPNTMATTQRDDGIIHSTETDEGYAPGDMAILGISMTVIGIFVGFAALRAYNNK